METRKLAAEALGRNPTIGDVKTLVEDFEATEYKTRLRIDVEFIYSA